MVKCCVPSQTCHTNVARHHENDYQRETCQCIQVGKKPNFNTIQVGVTLARLLKLPASTVTLVANLRRRCTKKTECVLGVSTRSSPRLRVRDR